MNFYLASGFSRRYVLQGLANSLEQIGHNVVSRWIYLDARPDPDDPRYDQFYIEIGRKNMEDMEKADALVIDMDGVRPDGNGGAMVEVGYFLAKQKPIYMIGRPTNSFLWQPRIRQSATQQELLDSVGKQRCLNSNPVDGLPCKWTENHTGTHNDISGRAWF